MPPPATAQSFTSLLHSSSRRSIRSSTDSTLKLLIQLWLMEMVTSCDGVSSGDTNLVVDLVIHSGGDEDHFAPLLHELEPSGFCKVGLEAQVEHVVGLPRQP